MALAYRELVEDNARGKEWLEWREQVWTDLDKPLDPAEAEEYVRAHWGLTSRAEQSASVDPLPTRGT